MGDLPDKLTQGLQSFNRGDYYEAHEWFEDAWRETSDQTREFFRALLHLSGGYFRLTQERPEAAQKFFERSLQWTIQFPSPYLHIDTAALKTHLEKLISALESGQEPELILKNLNIYIQLPGMEQSP